MTGDGILFSGEEDFSNAQVTEAIMLAYWRVIKQMLRHCKARETIHGTVLLYGEIPKRTHSEAVVLAGLPLEEFEVER